MCRRSLPSSPTSAAANGNDATAASSGRLQTLRLIALLSVMLSDGTYTVLRRYSRGVLLESYSVKEVLLVAEFIKVAFSCHMMFHSDKLSAGDQQRHPSRRSHLLQLLLKSRKMLILAAIYGLMNLLSYYALARVGAGTFVVVASLKTLTTAGFSVVMLGRSYSWTRWRALVLLVCGVVLFVLPTLENGEDGDDDAASGREGAAAGDAASGSVASDVALGVAAEAVIVALSGFASIYFEKSIKNDPFDIWERNFQLGVFSILMYLSLMTNEGGTPFSNWTLPAAALSFLGASGGLLVTLSIKYGDSVLKTLAVSGSIVYSSVVDHALLGGPLNGQMCLAAVVTIVAICNYAFDDSGGGGGVDNGGGLAKPPLIPVLEMETPDGDVESDGWKERLRQSGDDG